MSVVIALALAISMTTAISVTTATQAHADTGGYPWAGATYVDANYDWGYSTCPGNDAGCMTFYGYNGGIKYGESDPWGYYLRNCTSFVAWKLTSQGVNGNAVTGLGNGGDWYNKAPASERSSTPAPGDAAVQPGTGSNPYGHVAYVDSVSGSNITIEEYNYAGTGAWDTRTGTPSALGFSEFVNFGLNLGSGGSGGSVAQHGSDVDHNGASDLVLTTNQPGGGSAAEVGLSTDQGFWMQPNAWWSDPGTGWAGITPFVGDVNGDGKADYVFVANAGANGIAVYVALSNGSSFGIPQLWWSGSQFNYATTKFAFGDVDGNGGDDLVFDVQQPDGSPAMYVLLSTYGGYWLQAQPWLTLSGWSWQDTTPLVGDVDITVGGPNHQPDHAADLVLLTNSASGHAQAWVGVSSRSSFVGPNLWWDGVGYGYDGIKPVLGDVDGNGADDLILVTNQPGGGSAAEVLRSTWQGFLPPAQWWSDPAVGWTGITPMVADVTGDGKADFIFMANAGTASPVYVAASSGTTFGVPYLWWSGTGYGYDGIKPSLW